MAGDDEIESAQPLRETQGIQAPSKPRYWWVGLKDGGWAGPFRSLSKAESFKRIYLGERGVRATGGRYSGLKTTRHPNQSPDWWRYDVAFREGPASVAVAIGAGRAIGSANIQPQHGPVVIDLTANHPAYGDGTSSGNHIPVVDGPDVAGG